ncbi:hypothetical protein C8J56DRAFT_1165431 [Mycena floridula]|nr:hypothetical protein C8J56DRAFT_1165431 [Mycena floridula]
MLLLCLCVLPTLVSSVTIVFLTATPPVDSTLYWTREEGDTTNLTINIISYTDCTAPWQRYYIPQATSQGGSINLHFDHGPGEYNVDALDETQMILANLKVRIVNNGAEEQPFITQIHTTSSPQSEPTTVAEEETDNIQSQFQSTSTFINNAAGSIEISSSSGHSTGNPSSNTASVSNPVFSTVPTNLPVQLSSVPSEPSSSSAVYPNPMSASSRSRLGAVLGGVFGGLFVFTVTLYLLRRRGKSSRSSRPRHAETGQSGYTHVSQFTQISTRNFGDVTVSADHSTSTDVVTDTDNVRPRTANAPRTIIIGHGGFDDVVNIGFDNVMNLGFNNAEYSQRKVSEESQSAETSECSSSSKMGLDSAQISESRHETGDNGEEETGESAQEVTGNLAPEPTNQTDRRRAVYALSIAQNLTLGFLIKTLSGLLYISKLSLAIGLLEKTLGTVPDESQAHGSLWHGIVYPD